MIPKRQIALAVASFLAMGGAASALAQTQSDGAAQQGERERWNWQAGASRDRDMSSSREERWRRSDRARGPSDWDALGEFDSRSDDRTGRFAAGPPM